MGHGRLAKTLASRVGGLVGGLVGVVVVVGGVGVPLRFWGPRFNTGILMMQLAYDWYLPSYKIIYIYMCVCVA